MQLKLFFDHNVWSNAQQERQRKGFFPFNEKGLKASRLLYDNKVAIILIWEFFFIIFWVFFDADER